MAFDCGRSTSMACAMGSDNRQKVACLSQRFLLGNFES